MALATNGVEAVKMYEPEHYDIVFMDCQMPEMDGFEATAEIRNLPGIEGRAPIVALTANAVAGDAERCLDAGMDGYLSKPVKFEQLSAMLDEWTGPNEPHRADRPALTEAKE